MRPTVRSRRLGARLSRCRTERAVYVDGETSWTVHERDGAIHQYVHAFASVQAQALPPRESLDLIYTVIKEL